MKVINSFNIKNDFNWYQESQFPTPVVKVLQPLINNGGGKYITKVIEYIVTEKFAPSRGNISFEKMFAPNEGEYYHGCVRLFAVINPYLNKKDFGTNGSPIPSGYIYLLTNNVTLEQVIIYGGQTVQLNRLKTPSSTSGFNPLTEEFKFKSKKHGNTNKKLSKELMKFFVNGDVKIEVFAVPTFTKTHTHIEEDGFDAGFANAAMQPQDMERLILSACEYRLGYTPVLNNNIDDNTYHEDAK
jgi:hypothetical protein